MPATLRRPGNRIHTTLMSLQLRHRHRRRPDIQNHNLVTIHQNRRHVPQVLLVPRQSQQRRIGLRTLVDNRRVLLFSQIENPHRTVGSTSFQSNEMIISSNQIIIGPCLCLTSTLAFDPNFSIKPNIFFSKQYLGPQITMVRPHNGARIVIEIAHIVWAQASDSPSVFFF